MNPVPTVTEERRREARLQMQMEILKHLPDEAPERIMESVKNLEMKVLEECKGNAHDYVNIIGKKMKLCISRIYANKNKATGAQPQQPHREVPQGPQPAVPQHYQFSQQQHDANLQRQQSQAQAAAHQQLHQYQQHQQLQKQQNLYQQQQQMQQQMQGGDNKEFGEMADFFIFDPVAPPGAHQGVATQNIAPLPQAQVSQYPLDLDYGVRPVPGQPAPSQQQQHQPAPQYAADPYKQQLNQMPMSNYAKSESVPAVSSSPMQQGSAMGRPGMYQQAGQGVPQQYMAVQQQQQYQQQQQGHQHYNPAGGQPAPFLGYTPQTVTHPPPPQAHPAPIPAPAQATLPQARQQYARSAQQAQQAAQQAAQQTAQGYSSANMPISERMFEEYNNIMDNLRPKYLDQISEVLDNPARFRHLTPTIIQAFDQIRGWLQPQRVAGIETVFHMLLMANQLLKSEYQYGNAAVQSTEDSVIFSPDFAN